jgi:hypothetical protein
MTGGNVVQKWTLATFHVGSNLPTFLPEENRCA